MPSYQPWLVFKMKFGMKVALLEDLLDLQDQVFGRVKQDSTTRCETPSGHPRNDIERIESLL